jgi:anti-sigma factor RsiW
MLNRHLERPVSVQGQDNHGFSTVPSPGMPFGSSVSVIDSDDTDGGDPCTYAQASLSAYADNELNSSQRRWVASHLANCAKCAEMLNTLQLAEEHLQREWRDDSLLPSSLERAVAIDRIMDALPPAPETEPHFAPKRIHARARWTRFSVSARH